MVKKTKLKIIGLFFFIFCIFVSTSFAGTYLDLEPGVSTKIEADKVFGDPIREVQKGVRYDYKADEHDARRLSVKLKPDTQTIDTIDIYFKTTYSKAQITDWFQLMSSPKASIDAKGNLVERYETSGICLHYNGPDESSGVKFLSHYDVRAGKDISIDQGRRAATVIQPKGRPASKGKRPYLGVNIVGYDGEGVKVLGVYSKSPAKQAGVKDGDIILEVENKKFYESYIDIEEFADIISSMPVEKPLRFVIQRGDLMLELNIALSEISQKELVKQQKEMAKKAEGEFKKGQERLKAKEFIAAIRHFKKAIKFDSSKPVYYSNLGKAYYDNQDYDLAIEQFQKAISIKETYYPFYMLGRVYLDNAQLDQALHPLKRAVQLKDPRSKDTSASQLLGSCYFRLNKVEDALDIFLNLYKADKRRASADIVYYLAACFDRMGNARDATYYYKRYLRMKNRNSKKEAVARARLGALKSGSRTKSGNQSDGFIRMMDTITNEMKTFNQD